MKKAFPAALVLALISVPVLARAEEEALPAQAGPSPKRLGVYASFLAGDPGPSTVGLNVGYYVFPFLRAHVGLGAYNPVATETLVRAPYEAVLRPVMFFFAWVFYKAFTQGNLVYANTLDLGPYSSPSFFSLTYGGGLDLRVPHWRWSPLVGASLSGWAGPQSLHGQGTSGAVVGAKVGLDFVSQEGFTFAAGLNFFPTMSSATSAYANLGFYFY